MRERIPREEEQLEELSRSVDDLRCRVLRLEENRQQVMPPQSPVGSDDQSTQTTSTTQDQGQFGLYAAFAGRTCVVLGGAFFLRMLTESEVLGQELGIVLGLVYAAFWIAFADRDATHHQRLSSTIHGLTAAVIAFPLIWEATTSFGLFSSSTSAIALSAFTILELAVAWRGGRCLLAWITVSFSLAIGIGLLFETRAVVPFTGHMLTTAGAALWVASRHRWLGLPEFGALTVDIVVGVLTLAFLIESPEWLSKGQVVFAQLGLLVVYLGSFSVRHIALRVDVSPSHLVQMVIVFLLGFEGAAHVATDFNAMSYAGIASLFASVYGYGVAFRVFAHRNEQSFGFLTYTTVGAVALVEGCRFILPTNVAPLALVALGVVAAWLGRRETTVVFRIHSALFVLAAAFSGWAGPILDAFVGGTTHAWQPFDLITVCSLALIVTSYVVLSRTRVAHVPSWFIQPPESVVQFLGVVGLGGALISLLVGPIAKMGTVDVDLGILAVLRTAALTLSSSALAIVTRFSGRGEFRRLAWVFVILCGLKLMVEDVPHGRPGTLFVSLVLFGTALILVARRTGKEALNSDRVMRDRSSR